MLFKHAEALAPQAAMPGQPVIDHMLQFARGQHERGKLAEAQHGYRAVLAIDPANAYALHLLGVAHLHNGEAEAAEPLIARSLSLGLGYGWALANHGAVLVRLGRNDEALAVLDRALRLEPRLAPALVALGNVKLALQQYLEALSAYDAALAVSSALPEAWSNRGNVLRALNRPADALISYDRALALTPNEYATHLNSAHAWRDLGQCDRALQAYRTALVIRPKTVDVLLACGGVLQLLGREEDALACYDEILEANPHDVAALYNGCVVLDNLHRYDALLARCDRLLALEPDHALAWLGRGNALEGMKRHADALVAFDSALARAPGLDAASNNRGVALHLMARHADALESYDRALAAGPSAELYWSRGNVLQQLGRHDDALDSYEQALVSPTDTGHAWYMRGLSLQQLQRHAEAITCFQRAQELDPALFTAQAAEAFCRLLTGDFAEGWRQHENRWRDPSIARHRRHERQPSWSGDASVDGKTVLLHAEQGYGDTLQFCRYASLVAARGARVILEVPSALTQLMESLHGPSEVVSMGDPLPSFDLQCPLLSVPFAFGTQLDTIPSSTPYLQADAENSRIWADKVDAAARPGTLRIGLAWSGNPAHNNDQNRSVPLEMLAPLYTQHASFFSLHQFVRERDAQSLQDSGLIHFGTELKDFSDTAALVNALDLVISVDTSVIHLAGALGKPFWVLLPGVPDWRWLLEREDSPWYPQARLFRQQKPGDWEEVVARVARQLANRCAS
ncbi:Photosystem I assembly protein Ycf3 [Paraburkholderia sediminicola]|uniref:Photosystem I assembly protein Ycf3 n=1 Tax=Paraburkholderia sediminicola TaxID=458836 RepID=A0A6J5AE81_9BURK|nr:tetratricopeptide repeat protein [Paraburkholderia sediminicola]CAB3643694.1 Photosystem I assembly protein Ycf3 [Paraburkholderia sediminicola]